MSSYLIPLRQSFKMELGSKSGKRFSKSCPKKVPQDFQAPKIRKPFSIRQMDEKKHNLTALLQVLPVTTRTKHPLDKAAT